MRIVRTAAILLLILSVGIYAAGSVKEWRESDPTYPVLTSDREVLEMSVDYTEEELFAGLTAWDERDGDLTDQIMAGDFSHFIRTGVSNVTYVVFDSSNQATTLTRQVEFTDYEPPKLTLSQPLVFYEGETDHVAGYIGAVDMMDGDISSLVITEESEVSYLTAGVYYVEAEVINRFGDVEEQTLPVHILGERDTLIITLTENLTYITAGEEFVPEDYIAGLTDARTEEMDPGLIQVESYVDSTTPGCYEVRYYAEDGEGRVGETWQIVVVREARSTS